MTRDAGVVVDYWAGRLLTRPFAIRGTVQHGDKVGRTIGFRQRSQRQRKVAHGLCQGERFRFALA